jgi:hypothetical protein
VSHHESLGNSVLVFSFFGSLLFGRMDARVVPFRTSRSATDFWCRARLPGQVDDRGRVVSNPPLGPAPYDDLPFRRQDAPSGANSRLAGSDTDSALLRVEMTRMEAKMHAMAEHILAIEQENTLLKERLARVRLLVEM